MLQFGVHQNAVTVIFGMETGRFEIRNGSLFRTDTEYGTSESTDDTYVLSMFAALEKTFQDVADQNVRNDHAARAKTLRDGALFWRCFRFTHGIPDTVPQPLYFFDRPIPISKSDCHDMFVVFDGATLIVPFRRWRGDPEDAAELVDEWRVERQAEGAGGWIGTGKRTVDRRPCLGIDAPARRVVAAFVHATALDRLLKEYLYFGKQNHLFVVYRKYFPDSAYPLTRMDMHTPRGPLRIGDDGLALMFNHDARTLTVPAGLPACFNTVRDNETFWWDVIDHLLC